MQNKKLLLGVFVAVVLVSTISITQAYADKKEDPLSKIWLAIGVLDGHVNAIEDKLSVQGGTGSSSTLPPLVLPPVHHHKFQAAESSGTTPAVYNGDAPIVYNGDAPIVNVFASPADLSPLCNSINISNDTNNPDWEVLGWCPNSHSDWYFIDDSRATVDSIIIPVVHRGTNTDFGVGVAVCTSTVSGEFQFSDQFYNATTGQIQTLPSGIRNGFVVQCDTTHDVPLPGETLVWSLWN